MLASYNAAPHNRYQPHPAEPEQHTKCSNRVFVLLKMGIWCPKHVETEVNNKHLIVASCWFFSLHTLLTMHGHRNLKLTSFNYTLRSKTDVEYFDIVWEKKFLSKATYWVYAKGSTHQSRPVTRVATSIAEVSNAFPLTLYSNLANAPSTGSIHCRPSCTKSR